MSNLAVLMGEKLTGSVPNSNRLVCVPRRTTPWNFMSIHPHFYEILCSVAGYHIIGLLAKFDNVRLPTPSNMHDCVFFSVYLCSMLLIFVVTSHVAASVRFLCLNSFFFHETGQNILWRSSNLQKATTRLLSTYYEIGKLWCSELRAFLLLLFRVRRTIYFRTDFDESFFDCLATRIQGQKSFTIFYSAGYKS